MDSLQLVKDVMKLVTDNQPKEQIVSQAREVKTQITTAIKEFQQSLVLLDNIVASFAPDLTDIPKQAKTNSKKPSQQHIIELAQKYEANGVVDTSLIINQLRTEGDTRSERSMAISIGNILVKRSNYHAIGTGKYAKPTS